MVERNEKRLCWRVRWSLLLAGVWSQAAGFVLMREDVFIFDLLYKEIV
jgi:hypothetical protein